jgi:TRAP-type C4-dicarboxylate transport system permease small subunit
MYDHMGFLRGISRILSGIAVVGLIGMMALTCGDIVLRLMRHPIPGTWEVVGFLGAITAGFALVPTTLARTHVAVQLLVDRCPYRAQKVIYLVTHVLSIMLFALLTVESTKYGNALKAAGEVSNTLEVPFYPVLYGIGFSALVVVVILLTDIILVITRREKAWHGWPE